MVVNLNYPDTISLLKDITGVDPVYHMVHNNKPKGAKFYFDRNIRDGVTEKLTAALGTPTGGSLPHIKKAWGGLTVSGWMCGTKLDLCGKYFYATIPYLVQLVDRNETVFAEPGDEHILQLTLTLNPPQ